MRRLALFLCLGLVLPYCAAPVDFTLPLTIGAAAERYVRLVLALGERDADSLDSYFGPPTWQRDAHVEHLPLPAIRERAGSLADALTTAGAGQSDDATLERRNFLVRQLHAVVSRVEMLAGARPRFADEARALFGISALASAGPLQTIRSELDRELPGPGKLESRYAAFDRRFLIARDRLPNLIARAIEGCRAATTARLALPPTENVIVEYTDDLPWSAFTRYQGGFRSRIQINGGMPLTVDRALDLACHESYPGHHTIQSLVEARFGRSRSELLVQPLYSPQALLHEGASSFAPSLAFSETDRLAFERDVLFPLAGLSGADAARYLKITALVARLQGVVGDVARAYLDGELDFPRASATLAREGLLPSPDATLKFVNRYRSYAATYVVGRDLVSRHVERSTAGSHEPERRWTVYRELITSGRQVISSESDPR